jgi:hypothetical protein
MGIVKLPNEKAYWNPLELQVPGLHLPNFNEIMSWTRYNQFKTCRSYYVDTDHDDNDVAWKVRKQFEMFKVGIEGVMKYPGQFICVDEGMMKSNSAYCPAGLIRVLPQKPISRGFRFWVAVDKETHLPFSIHLDSASDLTKEDCIDVRGGFFGRASCNASSGKLAWGQLCGRL